MFSLSGFVHVWLRNSKGEYLISQRSADRQTDSLMWECVGGSVLKGETSPAGGGGTAGDTGRRTKINFCGFAFFVLTNEKGGSIMLANSVYVVYFEKL